MTEFSSCTMSCHQYDAHIAETRDALKALIFLEKRYYKRTNYLSLQIDEHDEDDVDDDERDIGCKSDYVKDCSEDVDESRQSYSPSADMIAEMASLVTDLRLASPPNHVKFRDGSSRQQQVWIRTPQSEPKSRQRKFRRFHSPTSSKENIYSDLSDEGSNHPRRFSNCKMVKRRRPTALEMSSLIIWRHQMLDWTFTLCHSVFPRNGGTVVAVAFNILDRYLSIVLASKKFEEQYLNSTVYDVFPLSKQDFQLFCMVSLYIAAKLWIPPNRNHLTITSLVAISQELYSNDVFCAAEREILLALDWHISPPTLTDFCNIYIDLLRTGTPDPTTCVAILRKCEYFAEMTLDDVFFLDKDSSIVALAIVLLSTDDLRGSHSRNKCVKHRYGSNDDNILTAFLRNIQGVVHIQNAEFDSILRRLEYFGYNHLLGSS
jgi:hypothetical protein